MYQFLVESVAVLFITSGIKISVPLAAAVAPSDKLSVLQIPLGREASIFGLYPGSNIERRAAENQQRYLPEDMPKFKPENQKSQSLAQEEKPQTPTEEEEHQPDLATLTKVLKACRRALRYFRNHVTQMNLDAVIGTRIAEAQFKMVLIALEERARMWKAVESVSRDIHGWITAVNSLRSLYMEAQQLNAIAEPHIKAAFPQYYSELGALLEVGFWEVPLTTKVFNITARPLSSPSKVLNGVEQLVESQSDKCVTEAGRAVLKGGDGSQNKEDDVDGQGQCSLSQKCWDLMTKPGYSGYSLTHQAFYLLIGLQAGCGDQEERFAYSTFRNGTRMTVTTLLEQICASVLIEANTIAQAGFPETRRDLFMEQGALCGMVGYRDFFRKQWLTKVLSWQRSLGCFGDLLLYNGIRSHLSVTNKHFPPHHSRVKREESPMAGRCLAHRTAVAVGYLSLYVRYLALALFK